MARPKKQTVDYFPHYCHHKKTMFILEQRYGNDGYAFWFKLLELLGDTEGHYLDLNDATAWEFLQAKTRLDDSFCSEILSLLAKLRAIDAELWEQKVVWCQNFVDGLEPVYKNRRVETPARPSFYTEKPQGVRVSTKKTQQSRVEESKVKNNNPPCTPPKITGNKNNKQLEHSISTDQCPSGHSANDQCSSGKQKKKLNAKKHKFAEFVYMTNDEYSSLMDRLGSKKLVNECIEILDNYKGSKGKKYRSDYRAILSWVIRRLKEEGRLGTNSGEAAKNNEADAIDFTEFEYTG